LERLLKERFPEKRFEIQNWGNCGEMAVRMVGRFKLIVDESSPAQLAIVLGGTNDIGRADFDPSWSDSERDVAAKRKAVEIASALTDIYRHSRQSGAHTLVLSLFESGGEEMPRDDMQWRGQVRKHITPILKQYCSFKHNRATFFDLGEAFPLLSLDATKRKELWADLIHPTAKGYDKIGELLFVAIEPIVDNLNQYNTIPPIDWKSIENGEDLIAVVEQLFDHVMNNLFLNIINISFIFFRQWLIKMKL